MSPVSLPRASTRPVSDVPSKTAPLAITARGLSKAFGARRVIFDLNLHVPAGQFVAIVGRSGCGKSTLLRLLSGLETPDAGTLRLGQDTGQNLGRDTGQNLGQRNVRLMFQEPRLLPWARVAANVAIGLGEDQSDASEKARAALRHVGLDDRADVWPSTLSGGQRQRVALARALVSRPGLLALDEPLGALDALTRIEMQHLIEQIAARDGFTAVLVTHDVSEAVMLADRVLVLEDGAITLDIDVDVPRPRRHGAAEAREIENHVLAHLFGNAAL